MQTFEVKKPISKNCFSFIATLTSRIVYHPKALFKLANDTFFPSTDDSIGKSINIFSKSN